MTPPSGTVEWSPAPTPAAASVLEAAGYPRRIAVLLARRGIDDREGAESFLHPNLDQLHDPFRLSGIQQAVKRLLAAREAGESVALVGDYDVDGVSGAAILVAVFRACGLEVHPILPHRMRDGYGFQPPQVARAARRFD